MAAPDDSLIHLIHTIWSAGLTTLLAILGWVMRWNWNRLVSQLDNKAEKESLGDVKTDLERRHRENLDVLREIKEAITKNDTEATQARAALSSSLQALVGQMGEIKGWISGTMQKGN